MQSVHGQLQSCCDIPGTGDGGGEVNTLEQGVQLNGGLGGTGQSTLGALTGSA